MKRILTLLVALMGLTGAWATDVVVDTITYELDENTHTACVKDGTSRSGDVVIPRFVKDNGVSYRVTRIGNSAFYECYALTSVVLQEGITEIDFGAFLSCGALTSVTFPESLVTIGNDAFGYCSALESIVIPKGVTTIGEGAFSRCSRLTSITLPNTLTEIGQEAFEGCALITSITIPHSVTEIGMWAFFSCVNLKTVTIISNVAEIGQMAFESCNSLTSVYAMSPTPLSIAASTFYPADSLTLYVPMGSKEDYEVATGWNGFGNIVELGWGEDGSVKGDMNDDGELSIADVTLLVDRILGREPQTPDPHEYVDLDLPSGTLWATCNVGADNPEDFGDYFAWGETVPYGQEDPSNTHNYNTTGSYTRIDYSWSTYKWCDGTTRRTLTKYCSSENNGSGGFVDNLTEVEPEDDAATANWGSRWQMPSLEQFDELINSDYITIEATELNGVQGYSFTSKTNGNSIFLPDAGQQGGNSVFNYWSRSLYGNGTTASRLYYNGSIVTTSPSERYFGRPIRPVYNP